MRLCLGTTGQAERVLQTLRSLGPHFGVRSGEREERFRRLGCHGVGRGPGRGFHWLLLPEHQRCFWHLANLTEAEPVLGAWAETVLK